MIIDTTISKCEDKLNCLEDLLSQPMYFNSNQTYPTWFGGFGGGCNNWEIASERREKWITSSSNNDATVTISSYTTSEPCVTMGDTFVSIDTIWDSLWDDWATITT